MSVCKAAVLYGTRDMRIEKTDLGDLKESQVLIKVNTTTLCPTDLRKYFGFVEIPGPIIVGHEISGTVEKIGDSISSMTPGDKVTIYSTIPCGQCHYCRIGMPELCRDLIGIGGSAGSLKKYYEYFLAEGVGGGLADYIKVPAILVVKLLPEIPLEYGSIIEPLANVFRGQIMCNPGPGKRELIFGGGPIGLMHLIVAKARSISEVIVVEPLSSRRRLAKELGATAVINPEEEDVTEIVKGLTDGEGPEITIVATGWSAEAECTELAVKLASKGSVINIFAATYPRKLINIDPNDIHYKELQIFGSFIYRPWNYYEAMELMTRNQEKLNKIVYPRFPIDEVKEAFECYGKQDAMKVAVNVN